MLLNEQFFKDNPAFKTKPIDKEMMVSFSTFCQVRYDLLLLDLRKAEAKLIEAENYLTKLKEELHK